MTGLKEKKKVIQTQKKKKSIANIFVVIGKKKNICKKF